MPGEEGASHIEKYTADLRAARGRSAEDLTGEVIDTLGRLRHRIETGDANRTEMTAKLDEIRETSRAAKVAATEAQRLAMPAGAESEAVRYYRHDGADDLISGAVVAPTAKLDPEQGRAYLAAESGAPIRMYTHTDDDGETRPGFLDDPNPRSEGQKRAQQLAGELSIMRALAAGGSMRGRPQRAIRRLTRHMRSLPAFSRMFADNATEGAEWIPDRPGSNLLMYAQMPRVVVGEFPTIPLEGNNLTNPFMTQGLQGFIAGTPAAGDLDPATLRAIQAVTGSKAYTTVTLAVNTLANRDATEDSIIAFFPVMQGAVAQTLVDMREDACLNGDTNGGDTGLGSWTAGGRWQVTGSDADHRLAYIGLRHRALDNSATVTATSQAATTDVFKLRGQLTKGFAGGPGGLMFVCSLEYLIYHMLPDPKVITVDVRGLGATNITGQVASVGGTPVVVSEFFSAELTAAGIYDDSTKTKTGGVLVNKSRVLRPQARGAIIETETVPRQHVTWITGSDREGLEYPCQSTEKPCALLIGASNDGS